MLTRRQHELLTFLVTYQKHRGVSPSYEEMGEALGLKSKSAVHGLIEGLEKKGYCQKEPNRARALKILKTPDADTKKLQESGLRSEGAETIQVPFFGHMTSSARKDLLSMPKKSINFLRAAFPPGGDDLFAFSIQGDFLKEWGILEGDLVVFQKTDHPIEGGVLLTVAGESLMIRKWEEDGRGRVTLKAANKYLIPEVHERSKLQAQGTLVHVSRSIGYEA